MRHKGENGAKGSGSKLEGGGRFFDNMPLDEASEVQGQRADHQDAVQSKTFQSTEFYDADARDYAANAGPLWRLAFLAEGWRDALAGAWRDDCDYRSAIFLWACFATALGASVYYILPDEPNVWVLLGLTFGAFGLLYRRMCVGASGAVSATIVMGLAGLLSASLHSQFFAGPTIQNSVSAEIVGVLSDVERKLVAKGLEERWILDVHSIKGFPAHATPKRVLLHQKKLVGRHQPGKVLRLRARLLPLQRPVFPGAFDYGRYLYVRGIGGWGFVGGQIEIVPHTSSSSFHWLERIYGQVKYSIAQFRIDIADGLAMRMEAEASGLAAALAVGKRDGLMPEVSEALRLSGLAHILAISGLHMAMVSLTVFWAMRMALVLVPGFALRYPVKQWAAGTALAVATGYLVLSGGAVSTMRAFVMVGIFFGAILLGRPALTLRNLALALVLLVLLQPFAVVEPGLQMSFAATAALIGIYDRLKRHQKIAFFQSGWRLADRLQLRYFWRRHPVLLFAVDKVAWFGRAALFWLGGIALTALIAGFAVLPFSVAHFQQVAPFGVLANLLAMPLMSLVIMPMGLVSLLLLPFGLQSYPLAIAEWGLDRVIDSARYVVGLSDERFLIAAGHWSFPLLMALALAILVIHRSKIAFASAGVVALIVVIWMQDHRSDLWVAKNGRAVAYRDHSGALQWLGRRQPNRDFRSLLRADGDVRALAKDKLQKSGDLKSSELGKGDRFILSDGATRASCDINACILEGAYDHRGHQLATSIGVVLHPSAFAEECLKRKIIVTRLPVPDFCNQPKHVIGPQALRHYGAHSITFSRIPTSHLLSSQKDVSDGQLQSGGMDNKDRGEEAFEWVGATNSRRRPWQWRLED